MTETKPSPCRPHTSPTHSARRKNKHKTLLPRKTGTGAFAAVLRMHVRANVDLRHFFWISTNFKKIKSSNSWLMNLQITISEPVWIFKFLHFCAMKGIHAQVTKWVLVCENHLKSENTRRFKFWMSRYPGRPGSRDDLESTLLKELLLIK